MNNADPAQIVTLTHPAAHVALITLNSPPVNTLSRAVRERIIEIVGGLHRDPEIRCLVLTGTGGTFTAGADLRKDMGLTGDRIDEFLTGFDGVLHALEDFRAPVIAAVNGAAAGGGLELALACDIRIAAGDAFFVASGVNVGLIASFWRLARVVGLGPAKEILLTGDRYPAERALRWGLVTEVHPPGELLPAALAKARRIASRPPLSVEAAKACAALAPGLTREQAAALQAEKFHAMVATDDHREAVDAFLSGRAGRYHRR
ncbi:enoyl-CoA hydratase/isomerase family protein [Spongiactinospora sp. 9N601]|uniref:enoyl-CoA hydratase/isomerase family protein n=1 Tax=Spongiactinospora sp. 9N601 TaxID=3375149 RepID=UPI0037B59718